MDGRITVIIPAKNAAATLEPLFSSLAAQTRKAGHIILVDDYSTDATTAIAGEWQQKLPLTLMANPRPESNDSRGAAVARNAGAQGIKDGYLFFCDADVRLAPEALALLEDALRKNTKAAFAYGPFMFGKFFRVPPFSAGLLRWHNYISTMSLVRAEDFPGFDEQLSRFQDWDLWLRIAAQGKRGIRVKKMLFTTDRRPDSISTTSSAILEDAFRAQHGLPKRSWLLRKAFPLLIRVLSQV